jgi:RNA polymerase sigma-70 factor, ECF subfamily
LRRSEDKLLGEIEAIYRERFGQFVAVAASIVGEREAARDVVQEAFASVVRSRRSFRRQGPLAAWVWRVVINAARKKRGRLGRELRLEVELPWTNGTAPTGEAESEAELGVGVLVAALPERQRLVLFLRYYADLDYREIAEILGVTTGTVSASLHAAHGTLRSQLQEACR